MFKNIDLPDVDVKLKTMESITRSNSLKLNNFLNQTICITISVILVFSMSLLTTKIYNSFIKDKPSFVTNSFNPKYATDDITNYFTQTEKMLMIMENE